MTDKLCEKSSSASRPAGLADLVSEPLEPSRSVLTGGTLVKVLVVTTLFLLAHYWQIWQMGQRWVHDKNWTHGFLIPLFSLYLLYVRRGELAELSARPSWWGLPVIAVAVLGQAAAFFVLSNNWIFQLNMVLLLLGIILQMGGWRALKLLWLPAAFLIFALPLPDQLYTQIALPLQNFAARSAGALMKLCNAQIEVTASQLTVITLSGQVAPLTVAEACSGVRSLMAFGALSVAYAYMENRPLWHRVILVAAAVPVAILCNVLRVATTSTMFLIDKPELGKDFMHEFTGMIMLIPALLMLLGLGRLLQSLFVEVEEDEDSNGDGDKAEGVTA